MKQSKDHNPISTANNPELQFYTAGNGPIIFQHKTPQRYDNKIINGSLVCYAEGDFGEILLQKVRVRDLEAWYIFLHIIKDVTFRIIYPAPLFIAHFRLENELIAAFDDIPGLTILKQGQFNGYSAHLLDMMSTFRKGRDYQSLDLVISPLLFTEYVTSAFPRLRQFLLPIRQHQSRFLLKGEAWFSKKVCNIFNDILSNKYTPKQVVYHFDAELKKLTLLLLYRISELSSQPEAFTHYEHPEVISKRLRKAKEIIDKTFPGNITLEALHQQLDISIRQLTNDFRKYYLMSIEEYVLLSKMDSALKWRQNGLQVKVIRIKLQYRNSGFFARSFKKTFGVNPNQVKKKK